MHAGSSKGCDSGLVRRDAGYGTDERICRIRFREVPEQGGAS